MSDESLAKTADSPEAEDALVKKGVNQQAIYAIKDKFANAVDHVSERLGETTIYVKRDQIVEVCRFLKDEPNFQFNLLSDLTGVDRGIEAEPRFEVLYHLTSLPKRTRLRLKVRVSEEDCNVPTVTTVWPTANWHERETFDLLGIKFEGHPDLRKILTPDDLEGHPLRKDFPLRGY